MQSREHRDGVECRMLVGSCRCMAKLNLGTAKSKSSTRSDGDRAAPEDSTTALISIRKPRERSPWNGYRRNAGREVYTSIGLSVKHESRAVARAKTKRT